MEDDYNKLLTDLAEIAPAEIAAEAGVPIEEFVSLDIGALLNQIINYIKKGLKVPAALIGILKGLCKIVNKWPWWLPNPPFYNTIKNLCKLLKL
jgi:hypothetical protein